MGSNFAIRTGDARWNQVLVTGRDQGGCMPPGLRQHDGWLERAETTAQEAVIAWRRVSCPEESAFFAALGLTVVPPPETRTAGLARRLAARLRRAG